MKIIGIEEHLVFPELLEAWSQLPETHETAELGFGEASIARQLNDAGERRLADMDSMGIDVQVLSLNTPGVQNLGAEDAVRVARACNDRLSGIVRARPDRFQAFATLPTPDPEAAAAELERAVAELGLTGAMMYGRTGTDNADAAKFDVIYRAAARLGAPLYLHPQIPVSEVSKAYYSGFGDQLDAMFSSFGLGWYYDNGIQLLRMIFGGVFDRNPELQVIVGHWGEMVLFFLDHIQTMETSGLKLARPLMEYFRQNVWVSGSGLMSERYLRWAIEVLGVERILYSTDYPFTFDTAYPPMSTHNGKARQFLETAPLTDYEKEAIGSGNWERLTAAMIAHRA